MNAHGMISLVERFKQKFGVLITWTEQAVETNPRGAQVASAGTVSRSAPALLLKDRFNPMKAMAGAMGLTHDHGRYLLVLPCVGIRKDLVIADNHGIRWKLGPVDWFDVGGVPIAKQAAMLEVA